MRYFSVSAKATAAAPAKKCLASDKKVIILLCSFLSLGLAKASEEISETTHSHKEGVSTECLEPFSTEEAVRMSQSSNDLVRLDFVVDGVVQGVFFRKYTQAEANKLGLRGFCRNTRAGTVTGSMEGPRQAIDKMKHWLRHTGSPMSKISDAVFKNEKQVDAFTFSPGFEIARTE